jgi:OOP family OmpA-OmpF porin
MMKLLTPVRLLKNDFFYKVQQAEQRGVSADEMKELLRTSQDTRGKKICAVKQVNFQVGKSVLTSKDKVYLDEIVSLMKTNEQIRIRVNGHSDNVGNEESNMTLSRERARAVYDYLRIKKIDGSRLSYEYFGTTRPIADNNTEDGRATNRRVEFEIVDQY